MSLQDAIDTLEQHGWRLDGLWPADSPRTAHLSRDGTAITVDLGARPAPALAPVLAPKVQLTQRAVGAFAVGRAGMQYRDLLPGRLGGHLIASHIRIPTGGPVNDRVHHHDVRFQLIACHRGWVRVVYEGQGPPFVLEPGDCVLQPPGIRHQVLEASDGLEVIELAIPAEHMTWMDPVLTLPTTETVATFGGQVFVRSRKADGTETGIGTATNGLANVRRVDPMTVSLSDDRHTFWFVRAGAITLDIGKLNAGDAAFLPAGQARIVGPSKDLALFEVTLPATDR